MSTQENVEQYYSHPRPEVQALVPDDAGRILDIGCGTGNLGAGLKQRQSCEVWGVEFEPEIARRAESILDRVVTGSIEDTTVLQQLPDAGFDVIVFADVLEHLKEPEKILRQLKRCLTLDGTIVASVPNIRHWSVLKDLLEGRWDYQEAGILDRTHLRFFTGNSLLKMFSNAGYEIGEAQGVRLADCEMLAGLPEALSRFDVDTSTLAQESLVYQFLLVARPISQEGEEFPLFGRRVSAHSTAARIAPTVRSGTPTPPENRVEQAESAGRSPQDPKASLIVLTCNQLEYTKMCLDSIFEHTHLPYELIVVDNGSSDGTVEYLEELSGKHQHVRFVPSPLNLGFGAGNNLGMAVARGEYVVLLNNDLVLTDGWLERMIVHAKKDERIGVVGPRSHYVSGPQRIPDIKYGDMPQMHREASRIAREHEAEGFEYPRVVGFCMLVKRAVIDQIGGFDEAYGLGNFEDDDFCWRANTAGFRCFVASDVYVHHFGSRTFAGEGIDHKSCMDTAWEWFKEKWSLDEDLQYTEGYPMSPKRFQPLLHKAELPDADSVPVAGDGQARSELAARYNASGERLYRQEKPREAMAFFHQAFSLDDKSADALNNLGVIATDQEDLASAAEFLLRAIDRDPENLNTLWNLISLYLHTGAREEAKELLKTYIRLNPTDKAAPDVLDELTSDQPNI